MEEIPGTLGFVIRDDNGKVLSHMCHDCKIEDCPIDPLKREDGIWQCSLFRKNK